MDINYFLKILNNLIELAAYLVVIIKFILYY